MAAFCTEGGVWLELGTALLALFGRLGLRLLEGLATIGAEGIVRVIEGLALGAGNLLGLRWSCRGLWCPLALLCPLGLGTTAGLVVDRGIERVIDLGLQARLANESGARGDHQGPEKEHTYRADRGLIEPLMLADRGGNASLHPLQRDGERGLEADQPFNFSPLADLDGDLLACAKVLHLVSLVCKLTFQVACQALLRHATGD